MAAADASAAPDAPRPRRAWSWRAKARLVFYPMLLGSIAGFVAYTTAMPGASYHGALAPLDDTGRARAELLRRDVTDLSGADGIGERSSAIAHTLERAQALVERRFLEAGYVPRALPYDADGELAANVEVSRTGAALAAEVVVIGAHYDSVHGAPGADDNASGVAVLLALARAFSEPARARGPKRTLRFVAFVNEEPPHFWNETMGSMHYAHDCKLRGDRIVAMLSLESLGYYRDAPKTQKYPHPLIGWFYPDRGDFVGFIGDLGSRALVRDAIGAFRGSVRFPSEGAALPSGIPGVGWSDQWSFWQAGYPGVMVTDTATFRNPGYHTTFDTPETLDYERLAHVTAGLVGVIERLVDL